MPIQQGDVVKVEYVLSNEKGEILDSSEISHGGPIKIQVGYGQVMRGLENALIGMETGQKKEVILTPADAFGEFDQLLLERVPKSNFPKQEIPIGKQIEYIGPSGSSSTAWVRLVEEDSVIIDMNHPLAGKTIHLSVKVLETGLDPDPTPNPFQMGLSCSGDACGHDHDHS